MFISPETFEDVDPESFEGHVVRLACTVGYHMSRIISLTERSHILRSRALLAIVVLDLCSMSSLLEEQRKSLGE